MTGLLRLPLFVLVAALTGLSMMVPAAYASVTNNDELARIFLYSGLLVLVVAGLIGLWGFRAALGEKLTIAFFGIRGVGSIYYLAYGLNHMEVAGAEHLWAILGDRKSVV